jgi:hypothetical protein
MSRPRQHEIRAFGFRSPIQFKGLYKEPQRFANTPWMVLLGDLVKEA